MVSTIQSAFEPLDVRVVFTNSSFQSIEKEIMAAHIVTFLQNNGNNWEIEMECVEFIRHTATQGFENWIYQNPLQNPIVAGKFIISLHEMVIDGYVIWIENLKKFQVTQKLVNFYSDYVV